MNGEPIDTTTLDAWVRDARRRTFESYADLDDGTLEVPYLEIINPPIWELGHIAWFQEYWVLRRALGGEPMRPDADALWNSGTVAHPARWSLPLDRRATIELLEACRDRVLEALARGGADLDGTLRYFTMLAVFHEDMHGEAFAYTRQTLGLARPSWTGAFTREGSASGAGPLLGDVEVPGGTWRLGAEPDRPQSFVFDNEKWAHPVELSRYRIARAPVTQAAFEAFVDDGGYRRRDLWTREGWLWRESTGVSQPLHWRRAPSGWQRRCFDHWVPLAQQPHRPVMHVCAHEAEAYCKWARRRLPTEVEWERAAAGSPINLGKANLDMLVGDTVDVGAFPDSDSGVGCRQMIGNVWEWTASSFRPYLGFERDPYAEYSEPWFEGHRVLRGGCFVTRARLLRPTWRNFYPPHRRDVWAGFRTCALD